jgi:Protein of unknown function (DUF3987)
MSDNPAGILVMRDELTGWLAQLDKPGREGERAFCLEAWNGDSPFTVDRIGRGNVHVPACCMSLLGGIQPARLRCYLVDALRDGPANDGLIQRFQVLVWPDTSPDWEYIDRAPDAKFLERVTRVFDALTQMDAERPARFRFSDAAQELFVEWPGELEAKVRGDDLHEALISHLSKYRKLMPSLSLIFELADQVISSQSETQRVSLEHERLAAARCDYLESHAKRVYSCVVTPQMRAARELAAKIKSRKIGAGGFLSCREIYRKGWSGLDSPELVKQAVEVLSDAGWVRPSDEESSEPIGRGRPSDRYLLNPRVWQ